MRKPEAFLVIGMIFVNLRAMKIKPLQVLITDDYIKKIEERLSKVKKNNTSYKNECELVKTQLLALPYSVGSEVALQLVYTTSSLSLGSMKLLTKEFASNVQDKDQLYASLFLQLHSYIASICLLINVPLIQHKALFAKALQGRDVLLAKSLLKNGMNPNGTIGEDTFLATAVKSDLYGIVESLLDYNADLNPQYGYHPLYYAALYHHGDIVMLLLSKGSRPNCNYRARAERSVSESLFISKECSLDLIERDRLTQSIELLHNSGEELNRLQKERERLAQLTELFYDSNSEEEFNRLLNERATSMPSFHDVPLNQ
jgi:hypothetical protein